MHRSLCRQSEDLEPKAQAEGNAIITAVRYQDIPKPTRRISKVFIKFAHQPLNTMQLRPLLFLVALLAMLSAGCSRQQTLSNTEGLLPVKGGRIWYKVIANPATANERPLVLLHGGPGFPSYYLSPLFAMAAERPIIVFDQLGCGRSDRTTDTTTMNFGSQMQQVEKLLAHLQVKDYYLYGHSYGTMLAVEYYFKHPQGIKALILGSPCMSTRRWVSDADTLMASLPEPTRTVLQNLKKGITTDSATAAKAMDVYFGTFYNHRAHVPRVDSSLAQTSNALYTHMWGESEFNANGTMKNYNRIPDLKKIGVPTLLLAGEFDAARPATVKYYASLIPVSKFVMIPNAGHSTMNDQPDEDVKAIRRFLNEVSH